MLNNKIAMFILYVYMYIDAQNEYHIYHQIPSHPHDYDDWVRVEEEEI